MMTDREIAIAHIAPADAETPEDAQRLREHWEKHIDGWMRSVHFGDCTKAPITCVRCVAEEA